jgi:hypothetical protein
VAGRLPVTVLGVDGAGPEQRVTLSASSDTVRPGQYQLAWPGGTAWVGPVLGRAPGRVQRAVTQGAAPPPGTRVAISWSFAGNPGTALGLPYARVDVPGELGPFPAWLIPPSPATPPVSAAPAAAVAPAASDIPEQPTPDTWAITVHGLNANRAEPLRAVPALHAEGLPVLDIGYRNDRGAPRSPDGLNHLGGSEWRDVEAAVRLARARGAHRVVLYGWSMGASAITQFLRHSPDAPLVSAVVFDSPVLSVPATMSYQAREGRLAAVTEWAAELFVGWRTGVHPAELDLTGRPPSVRPPLLLLQGSADTLVPASVARRFAAGARDWRLRYVEFAGAAHTQLWNADPERYDQAVREFLRPGGATVPR